MNLKSVPKNYHRGFSLVELLVVIAIIGILSQVVLLSVSSARTAAFDQKVKSQLSNIRSAAEIYWSSHANYGPSTTSCTSTTGMFADVPSGLSKLSVSASYPVGENTIVCNSNGNAYAVSDNLSASGTYWCVDSQPTTKQLNSPLGTLTACP
jgi:prepilin-type N-terminal cleavage/methylation domain-containing protein